MTTNADGAGERHPDAVTCELPPTRYPEGTPNVLPATSADPPVPGRRLWTYRVRDAHGHVHIHRGGPPREDGHLRTAPCGEQYVIITRVAR